MLLRVLVLSGGGGAGNRVLVVEHQENSVCFCCGELVNVMLRWFFLLHLGGMSKGKGWEGQNVVFPVLKSNVFFLFIEITVCKGDVCVCVCVCVCACVRVCVCMCACVLPHLITSPLCLVFFKGLFHDIRAGCF